MTDLLPFLSELYTAICKDIEQSVSPIGLDAFKASIIQSNPSSNSINLSNQHIGVHACIVLTKQLSKLNMIQNLDLSGNEIGNQGSIVILQLLKVSEITHLNLAGNGIEQEGMMEIAKFLESNKKVGKLIELYVMQLLYLDIGCVPKTKPNLLNLESARKIADVCWIFDFVCNVGNFEE